MMAASSFGRLHGAMCTIEDRNSFDLGNLNRKPAICMCSNAWMGKVQYAACMHDLQNPHHPDPRRRGLAHRQKQTPSNLSDYECRIGTLLAISCTLSQDL
jgi:hypothetical protein